MKRIALLLLLAANAAFGATLNPIQLLNPAGSTSGQAIVSTGPSTAPAWSSMLNSIIAGSNVTVSGATGNVTVGVVTSPAFNGVTANSFAGPATGFSISTVTGTSSGGAIQFFDATHGNDFVVLNGGATEATFGPAGLSMGSAYSITPSQTAGIVGTTTNNNATAGSVGEFPNNATTATSLTTATNANATSTPLAAGDWDVECTATFVPAGSTTVANLQVGINTTSATFAAANTGATTVLSAGFPSGVTEILSSPLYRVSLASSGTAFCVVQATFGASTMTVNGFIRARRPR